MAFARKPVAVIKARKRRFQARVVRVLRQIVLGIRCAGIGGVVDRFRKRVVGIEGQSRCKSPRHLERHPIEGRPPVPADRGERSQLWIGPPRLYAARTGQRNVHVRRTVGVDRSRADILRLDRHVRRKRPLDRQIPHFVVLNLVTIVDAVGANRARRILGQNILRRERPVKSCGSRVGHRLDQKERHVFGQVLQHAIRRLVRVDSKSRPHHRLVRTGNPPGHAQPRRKPKIARREQAIVPTHAGRGHDGQRADGRQAACRRRQSLRVTGDYKRRPSRRGQVDVRCLIGPRGEIPVVFVSQARIDG